jgi:hypothetical protein
MILPSPIFMLADNPNQVFAAAHTHNPDRVDSSSFHSTPPVSENASHSFAVATPTYTAPPSASSQNGEFITQADIGSTARQTNNIVNTISYYDVVFKTATTSTIKMIDVNFPAGILVGGFANFIEAEGIGPGIVSKSGQTLTLHSK